MTIFNNPINRKVIKKAERQKRKYQKRFKDDSNIVYHLKEEDHSLMTPALGIKWLHSSSVAWKPQAARPIIIGNIRMGYGHYRIAIALASCAKALGYTPYWFDLPSFKETTGGKVIAYLNQLYSLGSRLSSKYSLFNRFYWEPLNYEGFKKLSYNAKDQVISTLFTPIFHDLDPSIPFVATHVWPAQAAIHAKMNTVINIIPDNWPMALHLAQGSIHTVQTHSSYLGYKHLLGMDHKKVLQPMQEKDIVYTGHYVDHELIINLEADTQARLDRIKGKRPLRCLMTVGGAGAQGAFVSELITKLSDRVRAESLVLFINVGDHLHVAQQLMSNPHLQSLNVTHHTTWASTLSCVEQAHEGQVSGIHIFYHEEIMEAVYSTNILMRESDVLVTKPSELSFYPIPKCFIKRVGGHEMWGAIHSSELGDGTVECESVESAYQMMCTLLDDSVVLETMNQTILKLHEQKVYHGAYKAIELCDKIQ